MTELEALLKIGTALTSTMGRADVLYLLVKTIAEVIDVARCSVILVDEDADSARVLATFENQALRELTITLDKYPEIEAAIETGRVVFVEDAEHDALMRGVFPSFRHLNIASILVIPIMFHERVLGTLFLRTSRAQRPFTSQEILFCETASRMAANFLLSLTQYQLVVEENEKLADQSVRDSLTGLYNQAALDRLVRETVAQAIRYGRPLSCLMLDVDGFKAVNDRHGHDQGNEVLKVVAKAIGGAIRQSDIAARYGGDEFAILLPETDAAGARTKAERIRSAVTKAHPLHVTVSVGIACCPSANIRLAEDLIRRADQALYAAKAAGKDCVMDLASSPPPPPESQGRIRAV
ncbi:MAG: sensor domain-containing diguanylate cyclase [Nitrospiria bacterium]